MFCCIPFWQWWIGRQRRWLGREQEWWRGHIFWQWKAWTGCTTVVQRQAWHSRGSNSQSPSSSQSKGHWCYPPSPSPCSNNSKVLKTMSHSIPLFYHITICNYSKTSPFSSASLVVKCTLSPHSCPVELQRTTPTCRCLYHYWHTINLHLF